MIVKWHRSACRDLRKLRVYIANENPKAAARIAQRILKAVGRLSQDPAIGRPGRVIDTRELVVSGTPFLVPDTVTGDAIVILRVLHGARRWPAPYCPGVGAWTAGSVFLGQGQEPQNRSPA